MKVTLKLQCRASGEEWHTLRSIEALEEDTAQMAAVRKELEGQLVRWQDSHQFDGHSWRITNGHEFEVAEYIVTVKPAKGASRRIRTAASSAEAAKTIVANFELCPMRILTARKTKTIYRTA
jgi:hypothetical protein